MMTKLKESLAAIVAKFESEVEAKFIDVKVDDMIVRVDGESIEVGAAIYKVVVDAEGVEQVTPMEDGDIVIEDKVIVVTDGVISEIKDVEVEEEVPATEEAEAELPASSEFAEMMGAFESLASTIEKLQADVKELKSANELMKSDLEKFAAQPAAKGVEVPKKLSKDVSIYDILKSK